ncbi:predicted protein [Botrytis cinerea T4]|uniref:Uncharacterized protein n=1 Tax=Botryotinia fuckeliana (strain T4) TaxID=999810 RepID=G2YZ04_BOTF4|nr:predicted protein [Botrytis cinerea T4]
MGGMCEKVESDISHQGALDSHDAYTGADVSLLVGTSHRRASEESPSRYRGLVSVAM